MQQFKLARSFPRCTSLVDAW